jgi:hypothetical protein
MGKSQMYSSFCDFFPDVKFYPNWSFFVVSQICGSFFVIPRLQKSLIPDVWFKKSHCPRCHAPKTQMSQMCC